VARPQTASIPQVRPTAPALPAPAPVARRAQQGELPAPVSVAPLRAPAPSAVSPSRGLFAARARAGH
jgi:hypothetical protein